MGEALAHDRPDLRVLRVDRESPEGSVNADPALMAVEYRSGAPGEIEPVAIPQARQGEILDLDVARQFAHQIAMGFVFGQHHGRADHG